MAVISEIQTLNHYFIKVPVPFGLFVYLSNSTQKLHGKVYGPNNSV